MIRATKYPGNDQPARIGERDRRSDASAKRDLEAQSSGLRVRKRPSRVRFPRAAKVVSPGDEVAVIARLASGALASLAGARGTVIEAHTQDRKVALVSFGAFQEWVLFSQLTLDIGAPGAHNDCVGADGSSADMQLHDGRATKKSFSALGWEPGLSPDCPPASKPNPEH